MPYPATRRAETKAKIVRSARILFNKLGFNSVSISQIMSEAGLTHGVFYKYFESKSDLYIAVLRSSLEYSGLVAMGANTDLRTSGVGGDIVRTYLSTDHLQELDKVCPFVALPGDVARSDDATRQAFDTVFETMVGILERAVTSRARPTRTSALAVAAMCVGGMAIARASHGRALGDELRAAAIEVALELGGWDDERGDIDAREVAAAAAS